MVDVSGGHKRVERQAGGATVMRLPSASVTTDELPPSIYEEAWRRLRALPWRQWRSRTVPVVRSGVEQVGSMARVADTRGTPYTVK